MARLSGGAPSESARLNDEPTRHAYTGAGRRWANDAMLAYGPLAAHLVGRSSITPGDRVLDAGAGTGAVSAMLAANGALVISSDLEADMLRAARGDAGAGLAAVADITALSFGDNAFDTAVAGFVLNHLADPVAGLRELDRVTRSGGAVLASVFSEDRSPAKDAIDAVLEAHGWRAPAWYQAMKQRAAALATPDQMERAACRAGLITSEVDQSEVDVGLDDAALVVRYRFGMPQVSAFLDTLTPSEQARLVAEATVAVDQTAASFRPTVVELVARAH